jgi:branched-chain amino acid aminotransferase
MLFVTLIFFYFFSCYLHQGNVISTPAIKGTILPGITRKSIIDVALSKGFQV